MANVEPIRNISDIKKVEEILSKQNLRNFILFKLGINCGLRISDILSLNVANVKNKDYIVIVEQKTHKTRKIPINKLLKKLLQKYTKDMAENTPLFTSFRSKSRLDRFTAYKILVNACQAADIECNIGTHSLRKTFGYHYYKKYKDVAMLQTIFNHSNPKITLRYIGITDDEIYRSYTAFIL